MRRGERIGAGASTVLRLLELVCVCAWTSARESVYVNRGPTVVASTDSSDEKCLLVLGRPRNRCFFLVKFLFPTDVRFVCGEWMGPGEHPRLGVPLGPHG